jgi:EAL domain-containing protein (putative c-di-GMP-specific phosphodiesterase class I)/GGDEF domain-containing protein
MTATTRRHSGPPVRPRPPGPWPIALAALAIALATACSRLASFSGDSFSLIWPAAGIGFVLILVWGQRGLLALALGLAAWAIPTYWREPILIPIMVLASCAGPWLTWRMVRTHFQETYEPFARTASLYAFLRAEALVGIPIGTLIVGGSRIMLTHVNLRDVPALFFGEWIVGFCGAITFAPVVHALFDAAGRADLRAFWQETRAAIARDRIILAGVVGVAALGMASILLHQPEYGRAVLYLLLPLLAVNSVQTRAFPGHLTLLLAALAVLTTRAYASRVGVPDFDTVDPDLFVTSLYVVVIACSTLTLLAISSERRAALERLEEQAFIDPLTGLLSEAGLNRSLGRAVQRKNRKIGLISVRLVNEQAVEQLLGNEAARTICQRAGSALNSLLAAPTWARVGSGRFIGIISNVSHLDALMAAALAIVRDASGGEGGPACRPVWAAAAARGKSGAHITTEALLASLRDAEQGSPVDGAAVIFEVDRNAASHRLTRTHESERVRDAIAKQRIVLYAHAIVPNGRSNLQQRPGVELLTKLEAGDGGLIDAEDWLPLAMREGLMPALDVAVLRGAFAWFSAHPKALSSVEYCGINLSGSSVGDTDLVRRVRRALTESRLPPGKFMFEITEGQSIASPARASETIRALRRLGFKIAIDDFGTGLATFDYLKRFELDCIKIDGSFIHALANNPLDAAIVKSIVTVARAISVRTVAEYVGDQKILEIVSKLGVDASQGWAFGPPLPIAEFFAALAPEVAGANVTPLYPRRALQNV